jgi:hypothetical protein
MQKILNTMKPSTQKINPQIRIENIKDKILILRNKQDSK